MFNGVWCDNKKLIVKKARENNNSRQVKRARLQSNTGSEKGQDAVSLGQDNLVVEAREVNEAWLKSCAVGILNEAIKVESIKSAMESEVLRSFRAPPSGQGMLRAQRREGGISMCILPPGTMRDEDGMEIVDVILEIIGTPHQRIWSVPEGTTWCGHGDI
ncbi:hypothetical protein U1Q18_002572 [Sarracenia purpurea var. burkii]